MRPAGDAANAAGRIVAFGEMDELPVTFDNDGDGGTAIGLFRNGIGYVSTGLDGIASAGAADRGDGVGFDVDAIVFPTPRGPQR